MIIREAKPGDEFRLMELIKGLAEYENEPDAVVNTPEELSRDLFQLKNCEAIVAVLDERVVGFAIYYTSYSTWKGPCLFLEDLFIDEPHRGKGIGDGLFNRLVSIARSRNYRRMDWQVLEWNTPAIEFYKKQKATLDAEWLNGRLFLE